MIKKDCPMNTMRGGYFRECVGDKCAWWQKPPGRPDREGCAILRIAEELEILRNEKKVLFDRT